MTIYVGGVRYRLIRDSLISMITTSLGALGWFDAGRQHLPLNVVTSEVPEGEEVPLNTLAFTDDDLDSSEEELGSNFAEHAWSWYIDFYAENNSVGVHLIQDVKAILDGRFPSIGRTGPILPVYDYTMATPTVAFTCEIEDVSTHKAHGFSKVYQRHWHGCSFTLLDYHGSEDDT